MSLRLEALEGPTQGQTHAISGIAVLGRDPQSAIVIAVATVSREHAVVRPDEGGPGFIIEDLDSRSGTFVNGVRTRRAVLLEGDRVQIGPAVFKVWLREDALAGQVDPASVEDEPPARPKTVRMSLDAARFRLRAKNLESGSVGTPVAPPPPPPPPALLEPGGFPASPPPPPPPPVPVAIETGEASDESPARTGPPTTPAERLESIVELSSALAATHDQARLAREVVRRLLSFFPEARRVAIFDVVADGGRSTIAPKLVVDRQASGVKVATSVKISRAVIEEAVKSRQALLSEDPAHDPRFDRSKSTEDLVARAVLVAPLCVGDAVLGALYLDSQQGAGFDEGALRFLAGIASVVAPALENARLFARVQAETQRRALLERYFSPDMVEKILAGEVPLARNGEVRRGTILFTDIRGFTRLTDTTAPKVLVQTLNAYFEAMQRIIFRGRGTVERFGGDSILAYWSVIDLDPMAPRRAARAALAMQNELYRLNRELRGSGRPPIAIGIGVNTGDVIAGDVGSAERYEFTVLGDAINLARRIEDLAGAGEVLVGGATLAEIAQDALVRRLPDRPVKGKDRPVQLAALLGLRSEEAVRAGTVRWDLALAASIATEVGQRGDARLVALELSERDGAVTVELAAPFDLPQDIGIDLEAHLPGCVRAREGFARGNTAELERPIAMRGKVQLLAQVHETSSPIALQRILAANRQGLVLLSVRLEDPGPLLQALGLRA